MTNYITHKAKLLINSKSILGEGPVWDQKRQQLFWVDIEGCFLNGYFPLSNKSDKWAFKKTLGAALPKEDGKILLALESGLTTFDVENLELVHHRTLESKDPQMRFNDGKCDSLGNLWIGTMHKQFLPNSGNLYKVSPTMDTAIAIEGTTISNGLGWSPNNGKFYFIDTPTHELVSYDFDDSVGSIRNKKSLFKIPKSYGSPDGMCVDREGMLWIAHWEGNCVRRWNPENGKVLETIKVDAPLVTSCCFGGKDLDILYITTARSGMSEKRLKEYPLSGGLFFHKAKVGGLPTNYFKSED